MQCESPVNFWLNVSKALIDAYDYGHEHSTDKSTKLGATIVSSLKQDHQDFRPHYFGANRVSEELQNWEKVGRIGDLDSRPNKYYYTEHAERDALATLNRATVNRDSTWTMVCPWYACADCARAIVNSKVNIVIGHRSMLNHFLNSVDERARSQWMDSIYAGFKILEAGGVRHAYLDTPLIKFTQQGLQIVNRTVTISGKEYIV
jgi:deoxycytidylate deaminase